MTPPEGRNRDAVAAAVAVACRLVGVGLLAQDRIKSRPSQAPCTGPVLIVGAFAAVLIAVSVLNENVLIYYHIPSDERAPHFQRTPPTGR